MRTKEQIRKDILKLRNNFIESNTISSTLLGAGKAQTLESHKTNAQYPLPSPPYKQLAKDNAIQSVKNVKCPNQNIFENFYKQIQDILKPNSIIAGYYPIGSELNILPILEDLHNQSFKLALPVISNKTIDFYEWNPSTKMTSSKYNSKILEPENKQATLLPTIIIAPLIACDHIGNRIGSGKAMYDKKITQLRLINPNLIYIGLCHDFQLLEQIPSEKHDQKLNLIITETRIIDLF